MVKLLPCPFCGAVPKWVQASGDYGYTPSTLTLGCNCAMVPRITRATEQWEPGRGHYTVDPRPEMIAIWNTRVP
jgi:hypothetical protein